MKNVPFFTSKEALRFTICVIFIATAILVMFSTRLRYHEFSGDENYQALCVKDYQNSPLAMGVFYIGNLWTNIWGFSILSLRILCRFCYLISNGIGCFYLYYKTRNGLLSCAIFLLSSLICELGQMGIYNWDNGAYPIEALGTLALLAYIDKQNYFRITICGITCGIMTAFRLPLLTTSLLALAIIIASNYKKSHASTIIAAHSITGLIAMVVSTSICFIVMVGSYESIINSFSSANIISGHGKEFTAFLPSYIWRIKAYLPMFMISALTGLTCYLAAIMILKTPNILFKLIIIILSITIGWSILRINSITGNTYTPPLFGLVLSFIFIPILIPFYKQKNYNRSLKTTLSITVLIAMTFILGIGSDTPFQRWGAPYIIAFVFAIIWNLTTLSTKILASWIVLSISTMSVMIIYRDIATLKEFYWPKYHIPYRQDIPLLISDSEIWDSINKDIQPIIKCNKTFTFWGKERYPFTLSYEKEPFYSIQNYHFGHTDIIEIIPNLNELDYIFLTSPAGDVRDKAIKSLSEHDFSIVKSKHSYALMKNNHSNGNNRYN